MRSRVAQRSCGRTDDDQRAADRRRRRDDEHPRDVAALVKQLPLGFS
jgi:hypothetical protein